MIKIVIGRELEKKIDIPVTRLRYNVDRICELANTSAFIDKIKKKIFFLKFLLYKKIKKIKSLKSILHCTHIKRIESPRDIIECVDIGQQTIY